MARRGFGITGGLAPDIVRAIAPEAEARGYATFWANDTPGRDGLATLAEAAAVTSRIGLGVGWDRTATARRIPPYGSCSWQRDD